jgi:translocator protein
MRPLFSPWIAYPAALLLCFSAATLGSLFTTPYLASWYETIAKPSFNPPNWVFPVVWPILFLMMAIAVARIASLPSRPVTQLRALILFGAQLILNVLWSVAFFGRQSPPSGMLMVVFLFGAVATTLVLFWRLDRFAGALLVPYLAWVGFAAILNAAIVMLN